MKTVLPVIKIPSGFDFGHGFGCLCNNCLFKWYAVTHPTHSDHKRALREIKHERQTS